MSWFTLDAYNIPNLTLTCDAVSPQGYNAGYYCSEDLDGYLAAFLQTLDRDEQAAIMADLQTLVATDVPNVYIDTQIGNGALSREFTGFNLHPSQLLRFYTTHLAEPS